MEHEIVLNSRWALSVDATRARTTGSLLARNTSTPAAQPSPPKASNCWAAPGGRRPGGRGLARARRGPHGRDRSHACLEERVRRHRPRRPQLGRLRPGEGGAHHRRRPTQPPGPPPASSDPGVTRWRSAAAPATSGPTPTGHARPVAAMAGRRVRRVSARANTILARSADACAEVARRATRLNCARSSAVTRPGGSSSTCAFRSRATRQGVVPRLSPENSISDYLSRC